MVKLNRITFGVGEITSDAVFYIPKPTKGTVPFVGFGGLIIIAFCGIILQVV